jgi:hypothetical protein
MEAKLKAKELVDKYLMEVQGADKYNYNLDSINLYIAKQCAIIAVEEIIKHCAFYDYKTKRNFENCSDYSDNYFSTYWVDVKTEILNL